jgi:CheY-like chemotaxis protein/anti-sigma regulatory factor (Ser/Thr protein kinase)
MEVNSERLLGMSHDMRTPLNAIAGFTTLARKHISEPEYVLDCLNKVTRCSEYLLQLAGDTLRETKNVVNKKTVQKKPVSMTQVFTSMYEMFAYQAHQKNICFHVWQDEIVHEVVLMDELQLERVLLNLVGNAIQYTPAKGTVEVHLKELPDAAYAYGAYEITVRDSGMGMRKEYVPYAFEPFSRDVREAGILAEGTGLGLTIVKEFVDRIGGTINVQSGDGQGTCFILHVTFPVVDLGKESAGEETTKTGNAQSVFCGKRVLLAEDDYYNTVLMKRYLEEAGCVVDAVANGREAVKLVADRKPGTYDCILLDLGLPVLDGLAAAKTIRSLSDERRSSVPIVAITGNVFPLERQRVQEAGMNGYISKPVDQETLERVLSAVMG